MSTLAEAKSLLAKIRAQAGSAGGDVDTDATAGLATLCREARARLAECDRFKTTGDLEKALRLAEEPPELLELADMIARLERAPGWANFAAQHELPAAPALGAGTSDRLLELYRSWDGTSEFLWRKYRDTMMRRDEDAAVVVSQRIFRIDPSDHAARDEVNRVGRRLFKEKLVRLEELVECGDSAAAIKLVGQLNPVPFDDLKVGQAWEDATKMRNKRLRKANQESLARLLAGLPALRQSKDLEGVQHAVAEAEDMINHLALDPGDGTRMLEESEAWIKEETERRKLAARLGAALDRCQSQVEKIQSNWGQLRAGPISEVESALRKLNNCWSDVEKSGGDPGDELGARVAKWRSNLEKAIRQDTRRRTRRRRVSKTTIGTVVFAIVYCIYAQWRGSRIVDRMSQLQSERKALSLRKTVLSAEKWSFAVIILARIRPEVDRSHAWLVREERHRRSCSAMILDLAQSFVEDFEGPVTTGFHAKIEALKNEIADAAVDLQPGLNGEAASLFGRWEAHVNAFVAARQQTREAALAELEEGLANMPSLSEAGRDEEFFLRFTRTAANLDRWIQPTIPPAKPRKEIAERMREIDLPLRKALAGLTVFHDRMLELREATNYQSYITALRRLRNAPELIETPEKSVAAAIVATDPKQITIIGEILAPSDPAGWDWFSSNREKPEFFPGTVEESERKILVALHDDKNLSGIYSCHFRKLPSGKSFYVHAAGPTTGRVRKATETVVDRTGLFFDGVAFNPRTYSLQSGRGSQFISEGLSSESALFNKIRPLEHLMSQSQQYYHGSFFPAFDHIVAAADAEPLFRAHLQAKLGSVILKRPNEWGSVLSPRLIADLTRLGEMGARSISSIHWLTPDLNHERAKQFREFYASVGQHRYELEAKLNRKLIERTLEIGFGHAGFIDLDGALMLTPQAGTATELFGHGKAGGPAKLLFRKLSVDLPAGVSGESDEDLPDWEQLEEPAAFTALLYFKGDRDALLEAVAQQLGIPAESARAIALPFFSADS